MGDHMMGSMENANFVSKTPMMQTKWKKHRAKLVISLVANHTQLARASQTLSYLFIDDPKTLIFIACMYFYIMRKSLRIYYQAFLMTVLN